MLTLELKPLIKHPKPGMTMRRGCNKAGYQPVLMLPVESAGEEGKEEDTPWLCRVWADTSQKQSDGDIGLGSLNLEVPSCIHIYLSLSP